MSHMPTTEQPGAISLLLQQVGVSIGVGPFRTLNFHSGATVVDAGNGVAQIDVSGGGGGSIPDGSVTLAKLADMAQSTFIGRHAGGGTGVPEALTAAQVKTALAIAAGTDVSGLAAVALSGSASDITTGTLPAAQIGAGSLALSKLANQATATILGNNTGGAAAPIALTAAQTKTLLAITSADVSGLAAIATSGATSDLVGSVSLAQLATQAQATFVGRAAAAGTGVPSALTAAQAKTALAIASSDVSGLAAIATSGSATDLSSGSIPSGRYAANTMVAATFAAATTQRVLGRNTAGAGQGEEVTASQLIDWVSSTNGALLTRTAGAWAALANVATDNGDLQLATNTTPVTPAAGKTKLFGASVGGRTMLGIVGATGAKQVSQPLLGQRAVGFWLPNGGGATTLSVIGVHSGGMTGTATARAAAATNLFTGTRRLGLVSAAGAGSATGIRTTAAVFWRGNAAGAGGFHVIHRFGVSDAVLVGTGRLFAGLSASVAALTDIDPSTLANVVGVGCDASDTTLQLYASGAVAQTRTSLGASFPANTVSTDLYELALFAAPNDSQITWQVTRLNTGDSASGAITAAASLPANTTFMAAQIWRSNGGTASAVAVDVISSSFEADN